MAIPEIDIIGTGSLAYSLAPALEQSGLIINNVFGRNIESAKNISDNLYQAYPTTSLDFSSSKSNLFLLVVSDNAIDEVSRELILPDNAIVAHSSGTKGISVLGYTASSNIGVMFPLQSFIKGKRIGFNNVPLLIEGHNKFTRKVILAVANKLSTNVSEADSKQRQIIHLAAVIAANFTNSLLYQSNQLLKMADVNLDILTPLLEETIEKSLTVGPLRAQSGPAFNSNLEVLDQHMGMLERYPDIQEVYRLISQQILDRYEED